MLKQEVNIACGFQQKIHILLNNNEERNVDELGVTIEVTEVSYSLGGSKPTPSRTNGAVYTSSLIQRAHAQTNVHL